MTMCRQVHRAAEADDHNQESEPLTSFRLAGSGFQCLALPINTVLLFLFRHRQDPVRAAFQHHLVLFVHRGRRKGATEGRRLQHRKANLFGKIVKNLFRYLGCFVLRTRRSTLWWAPTKLSLLSHQRSGTLATCQRQSWPCPLSVRSEDNEEDRISDSRID